MAKVDKVLIIGGGSAGWMSAATLIHSFPNMDITLVESPDIPKIGVGESTLAGLPAWLNAIEVDHEDFMAYTDASYKFSIRFTDFHRIGDGGFQYPFGAPYTGNAALPGVNDWHLLKHYIPETTTQSYAEALFPNMQMINSRKIIRENKNGVLDTYAPNRDFALQFDAIKFADWLCTRYAMPRGVKRILSTVTSIDKDENGIKSVTLEDGTNLTADLYIDCTGFKSMLLGGELQEPFVSYADKLPVNKAWAVQLQYENPREEVELYTDCTALGYGWVWNAPLYSRIGTGYVYSNRFTTDEEALEEFKEYLRKRVGAHRVTDDLKFRNIDFKAGIYRNTWVKNVVAIGLSGAFLEPLESNGLFFIHENLVALAKALSRGYYNGFDRDAYNNGTFKRFDYFAEFIEHHYVLSSRRDTEFWKYMTERDVIDNKFVSASGDKYTALEEARFFQQEYAVALMSGLHCIAVGHEYYTIDKNSIKYWEHNWGTDYKKVAADFAIKTEKSQKKWREAIKDAPNHWDYLHEKFHKDK